MSDDTPQVARARKRADEARARLVRTFDELLAGFKDLQRRLEPSHMAKDAWEAAKSKGADLAEDAVDAVSKRPVAATGVVAAIALFLAREPLMDLAGKLVNGKGDSKPRKPKKETETTS